MRSGRTNGPVRLGRSRWTESGLSSTCNANETDLGNSITFLVSTLTVNDCFEFHIFNLIIVRPGYLSRLFRVVPEHSVRMSGVHWCP